MQLTEEIPMKLTSFLIASAASFVAASVSQAADAIVAAEPEPLEYVRVCDAFGTGYFYIPGTETCLKIGGYIRLQLDGRSNYDIDTSAGAVELDDDAGYRTNTRAQLRFEAKSDTEFGALGSRVTLRANNNSGSSDFALNETYIELGGFRIGYFYNYFDTGLPGETVLSDEGPLSGSATDIFGDYIGGDTLNNSIRYTFESGAFTAYGQADFFNSQAGWKTDADGSADEIGLSGLVGGKFDAFSIDLFGAYEFDHEDGVVASTLSAEIGPGKLGVFGVYSSGPTRYWDYSEWTIGAEYAFAVSEKFKLTPGVQYWDNIIPTSNDYTGGSAWRVGVTADYQVTPNLLAKATFNYNNVDIDTAGYGDGDRFDGFLRLQRDF
jgi:hypothetical protein